MHINIYMVKMYLQKGHLYICKYFLNQDILAGKVFDT